MFERTCEGKVRILLGSTNKLGTGVNVQDKVIAINHLDCPWRPSDITQRDGRGVRQGNENPEVMIKHFVTKGTFDAYLWQIQEQKLRYIKQILTGRSIARSCEDVDETVLSAAQFKAAATDNPMLAQKMELEKPGDGAENPAGRVEQRAAFFGTEGEHDLSQPHPAVPAPNRAD